MIGEMIGGSCKSGLFEKTLLKGGWAFPNGMIRYGGVLCSDGRALCCLSMALVEFSCM